MLSCVNSSHGVTRSFSCSNMVAIVLGNPRRDILDHIEAYGDKGNILRLKLEKNFLRKPFVMFEFKAQNHTILFMEKFANTVFLESTMEYFRAY